MFAFAALGHIDAMLDEAGFVDVEVEGLDLKMTYAGFDEWWAATLELSRPFVDLVKSLPTDDVGAMREAQRRAARPFTGADGALCLPGRPLVAAACGGHTQSAGAERLRVSA